MSSPFRVERLNPRRPRTALDAEVVAFLLHTVFYQDDPTVEVSEREIHGRLRGWADFHLYAMFMGKRLVGGAAVLHNDVPGTSTVKWIGVAADMRGQGGGHALVRDISDQARSLGDSRIELNPSGDSRPKFERMGFSAGDRPTMSIQLDTLLEPND